jgi:hypothetical protein
MDDLIGKLANADTLSQALAVTVGGIGGVFVTLLVFYLIIKSFELFKAKNKG